jgi:membrane-associated phospholipid phosphatase
MYAYELLAIAYFSALLAMTVASDSTSRRSALAASAAAIGLVILAARLAPPGLREWAPQLDLLLGYWIPGLMVAAARDGAAGVTPFERWLRGTDEKIRPRLPALPDRLGALTELAYLLCTPLVPISFAVVWWLGGSADVSRFWLSVLGAGYPCYGSLPWLLSRPPRSHMAEAVEGRTVRAANVFVLSRLSHEWNTFPSGHVAVSFAAAFSAARLSPEAGAVVGFVAAGVAVGAVVGRYHYVVDVIAGIFIAAVAAMVTW